MDSTSKCRSTSLRRILSLAHAYALKTLVLKFALLLGSTCCLCNAQVSSTSVNDVVRIDAAIQRPGSGKKLVLLKLVNDRDYSIEIDGFVASCACSKNVVARQSKLAPGQSAVLELSYTVPNVSGETLDLGFSVQGHKIGSSDIETLRQFSIRVPVYARLSLVDNRAHLAVSSDGPNEFRVVNSSGIDWATIKIEETSNLGATFEARTLDATLGNQRCQLFKIGCRGLERFLAMEREKRPQKLSLDIYGTLDSTIFEFLGSVSIPIRWISAIEFFPRELMLNASQSSVDLNLVGRAVDLEPLLDQVVLRFGGETVSQEFWKARLLSRKWLRITIEKSAFHERSEGELLEVSFRSLNVVLKLPIRTPDRD